MKNRMRKKRLYSRWEPKRKPRYKLAELLATMPANFQLTAEDRAWLDMAPVGREFGSPDYERLVQLDALADAAKAAADRAGKSIDDMLSFVAESNKRIQDMDHGH